MRAKVGRVSLGFDLRVHVAHGNPLRPVEIAEPARPEVLGKGLPHRPDPTALEGRVERLGQELEVPPDHPGDRVGEAAAPFVREEDRAAWARELAYVERSPGPDEPDQGRYNALPVTQPMDDEEEGHEVEGFQVGQVLPDV